MIQPEAREHVCGDASSQQRPERLIGRTGLMRVLDFYFMRIVMWYVLLIILAALVLFNAYVSRVVIRSKVNDESQKKMQLAFVWLLPAIGAMIALHVLKPSRNSMPGEGAGGMEYRQAWDYAGHDEHCPPDAGCGE